MESVAIVVAPFSYFFSPASYSVSSPTLDWLIFFPFPSRPVKKRRERESIFPSRALRDDIVVDGDDS